MQERARPPRELGAPREGAAHGERRGQPVQEVRERGRERGVPGLPGKAVPADRPAAKGCGEPDAPLAAPLQRVPRRPGDSRNH